MARCAALVAAGARENFVWARLGDVAAEFMAAIRDEEVYVACADGEIVGVAALYRPGSFVHYLFVDKAWRSRGLGGDLLAVVGALASSPVSLKVDAENLRAREFYEREAWSPSRKAVTRTARAGCGWAGPTSAAADAVACAARLETAGPVAQKVAYDFETRPHPSSGDPRLRRHSSADDRC